MHKVSKQHMSRAIKEASKNIATMQGGPFGACIVKERKVIAVARNTVLATDATAHAEINAIRKASRKLKTYDLCGCVIYSTTEPCPMCFAACHWARIDTIIYGNNICDAKKIGFNELRISCRAIKKLGAAKIKIIPGVLRKKCNELFKAWDKAENKKLY